MHNCVMCVYVGGQPSLLNNLQRMENNLENGTEQTSFVPAAPVHFRSRYRCLFYTLKAPSDSVPAPMYLCDIIHKYPTRETVTR